MPSVSNVSSILDKIRSAATPPKFTHDFLKSSLGFGSSNDRTFIKVLKQLGFLDADSTPTDRYNQYRGQAAGAAMADGLRSGWGPLFLSDERVYDRTGSELLDIVKNATGSGEAVARKIASTFKALAEKADWTAGPAVVETDVQAMEGEARGEPSDTSGAPTAQLGDGGFRLHHDIHLHLPPTSDVGVYRAIFKAMKSELM